MTECDLDFHGEQGSPTIVYGGFWIRAMAHAIDGFVIAVLTFVLSAIMGALVGSLMAARGFSPEEMNRVTMRFGIALGIFLEFFYYGVIQGLLEGSLGKRALGLRLVRDDLTSIGIGQSIGRFFASLLAWLPVGIGVIAVGFHERKQGWHDRMAGTLVIRK